MSVGVTDSGMRIQGHWRTMEFVPIKEACVVLCESVRTFWRRVAEGLYPQPIKNGARRLVVVDWLRAEVERRKQGAGR